jgi:hypothetical protein
VFSTWRVRGEGRGGRGEGEDRDSRGDEREERGVRRCCLVGREDEFVAAERAVGVFDLKGEGRGEE